MSSGKIENNRSLDPLESITSQIDAEWLKEDRYRVFVEDMADGYYETNLRGDFVFFNDAFCQIFRCRRDELQGRNYRDFMDPENSDAAFKSFNAIFRSGIGLVDIHWEIIRKDGATRILENSANLIFNEAGEKIGFRGISRDVTATYRAREDALEAESLAHCLYEASRRAEQRYRAFIRFLPDPVLVLKMDNTVSYLNPTFEETFGWSRKEMEGQKLPFVPEDLKDEARRGVKRLFRERTVQHFETKRLTKEGRLLDVLLSAAVFYDEQNAPAGQVVILRDITREKRTTRSNEALFRIAGALHRFRRLDDRLEYITREVKDLMAVGGALVILIDDETNEFYFRVASMDDTEAGKKMQEIRYPLSEGVAGEVYRTGKPIIVPDAYKSPYFIKEVDQKAGYSTRNMLDVPIQLEDKMIGVLGAVNKKNGDFDEADVTLLCTVASMVALPIENARINEALRRSYEEVRSLNRAKDRVIHHLSHELKTPLSVLSASLELLRKKVGDDTDPTTNRILARADRNLQRILDMQYQIQDILRERHYQTYLFISDLLDSATDVIETFAEAEPGGEKLAASLRRRIESVFGPVEAPSEEIHLDWFAAELIDNLRSKFSHRTCRLEAHFEKVHPILIPVDVLSKIIIGLVRNAVENTPDGGLIQVFVRNHASGTQFVVKDYGTGITEENQRLIFENYFTSYDTMTYASRQPYDFNAGGKGFDLLRMKIFSERYHFKIEMDSKRCPHIPDSFEHGPGDIDTCEHCESEADCLDNGGTTMTVTFPAISDLPEEN